MPLTLDSITVGDPIKPARTGVYGPDGVGKTSFAAGAPSPIFIRAEDGLGLLKVPAFPPAQTFHEALEAIALLLREPHTYRTLVIDSLDWLEGLVWAHTCQKHGVGHIEEIGGGYGKGYLYADDEWDRLFRGLDLLRINRGMGIILICHSEIKRFDAPDSAPYDRYQLKLQKRAAAKVAEWVDVLGFANFVTTTRESDVGFGKKVVRGMGAGDRELYVEERPAFDAKNRYNLPASMPLEYAAFRDALVTAVEQAAAQPAAEPSPAVPPTTETTDAAA